MSALLEENSSCDTLLQSLRGQAMQVPQKRTILRRWVKLGAEAKSSEGSQFSSVACYVHRALATVGLDSLRVLWEKTNVKIRERKAIIYLSARAGVPIIRPPNRAINHSLFSEH